MKLSLLALIRVAQLQSFGEELKSLSTVGSVLKGKIATLSPFLDSRGLMRVGGRLIRADLPQDIMHPILLPKKHKLTELIIRQEHLINLHAGTQLLLATIQRKYWIMGARDIIGFWIRKCIVCTRHKAEMLNQRMADLPSFRVIPCRPFLKTGVDYSGPFMLRSTRCHDSPKCYIAIFVCMVTTAIHIELVESLSTTAFIDALMRFVSRRGRCTDVFTDCGRNFVGAEKELKFMKAKAHLDQITSVLSEKEINFHFNPPGSPHFGGLWEAGIKSIKFHFKRVIGNTKLNYPQMLTLLTQIEACLNSRPMSALSSDPEILQPLTPGHFLIGDALTAIPEPDYATLPMSSLTRFQLRQKLVQAFWKRWSKEYLTRLQQRPKWWTTKTNLDIGDLVLINDERQPPMKWKMGRVIELHPGKDSLVRVASLKTAEGIIKRPIVKLSPQLSLCKHLQKFTASKIKVLPPHIPMIIANKPHQQHFACSQSHPPCPSRTTRVTMDLDSGLHREAPIRIPLISLRPSGMSFLDGLIVPRKIKDKPGFHIHDSPKTILKVKLS
ncbi:unnamed protein product [Allacma fusca]|uniref:Integrase catalytic domain-containing protein n=1 Tax=Allacma fusca TaxID=39272 RepID=A0A8J2K3Z9_9HEXA|nr:unnamed protein product [Allacma fusca]